MRRRLFNILSALSLVVCVAVAALWVRSYWTADFWPEHRYWRTDGVLYMDRAVAGSCRGELLYIRAQHLLGRMVSVGELPASGPSVRVDRHTGPAFREGYAAWRSSYRVETFAGFGCRRLDKPVAESGWAIVVPYGGIATLLALLPAAWLLSLRRARLRQWRMRNARCVTCGYDLRATPDRCPECVTPVPSKPQTHSSEIR